MVSQTSKEIVRRVFSFGSVPRTPFIPWVCTFAAKLEQVSIQRMLTSSDVLAKALQNAQKLYGYDGVVNIFDPTLEGEACGCHITWGEKDGLPSVVSHPLAGGIPCEEIDASGIEKRGRLPIVLEATKRLSITTGKTVALVGVITGPLTLAAQLKGCDIITELEANPEETGKVLDLAGKVAANICRSYCELNVDLILIAEELLGRVKSNSLGNIASCLRPVWNVARFYSAYSMILTKSPQKQNIFALGADGVVLDSLALQSFGNIAIEKRRCLGMAIPLSVFLSKPTDIVNNVKTCLCQKPSGPFFLTSAWEIPFNTPVENMHQLMHALR